jgi:hypothetical protein
MGVGNGISAMFELDAIIKGLNEMINCNCSLLRNDQNDERSVARDAK